MMRGQVPYAFIAALRWEGVSEEQIDAALTRIENSRLGESLDGDDIPIRMFSQDAGARFTRVQNG